MFSPFFAHLLFAAMAAYLWRRKADQGPGPHRGNPGQPASMLHPGSHREIPGWPAARKGGIKTGTSQRPSRVASALTKAVFCTQYSGGIFRLQAATLLEVP